MHPGKQNKKNLKWGNGFTLSVAEGEWGQGGQGRIYSMNDEQLPQAEYLVDL